jgi:geranylgeranyl diphosphate synthase type I
MQDDLLGLWGDPNRTGKPVGSDILKHKKTLPIIHGSQRNGELLDLLNKPTLSNDDITHALDLLEAAGSRTYTESQVKRYHREALKTLDASGGQGKTQKIISQLVNNLLDRQK